MNARYTDRAQQALELAREESRRLKSTYVGTEHLLLGLVKTETSVAANVLKNLDVPAERVLAVLKTLHDETPREQPRDSLFRRLLAKLLGVAPPSVIAQGMRTPNMLRAADYAAEEAERLDHNYIGTEHLLLGLLREEGVAAQLLVLCGLKRGAGLNDVREELQNLIGRGWNRSRFSPSEFERFARPA